MKKKLYFTLFFWKMNKGDLPLMCSYDFWCEFNDLVVVLAFIV